MRELLALAAAAATVLLGGCATTARVDPLEPANRAMYAIHEPIDRTLVRPAIQAYVDHVPQVVRLTISNFFNNIDDLYSGINGLLQGKPDKAGHDFGRVMVNSFIGLGGLIDVASDAGIPRGEEDFGQTFARWGIPHGAYLFIPLLGPTSVRDGGGFLIRAYTTPVGFIGNVSLRNVIWGLGAVDLRAQALEAQTLLERAALDPYTFTRRAYLQRREYLLHDGLPPPAREDDE